MFGIQCVASVVLPARAEGPSGTVNQSISQSISQAVDTVGQEYVSGLKGAGLGLPGVMILGGVVLR